MMEYITVKVEPLSHPDLIADVRANFVIGRPMQGYVDAWASARSLPLAQETYRALKQVFPDSNLAIFKSKEEVQK